MRTKALVALAILFVACNSSTPQAHPARSLTGTIGAAAYQVDVPADWNGTLFLWSHGYVAPGGSNPAQDAPTGQARAWLLQRHYALAGSSYSSTGWALEDAFKDQVALLDFFNSHVGKPKRVIAWGASLGGIITAGLVQLHPERFAAAMPLCGVLAGGIATWNSELDAAYAFKTLLAPQSSLQLAHVTDGAANMNLALSTLNAAAATSQGQARLALVAALIDLPGWFDPTRPEPAPSDYVMRAQQQILWESRTDFAFAFRYRTELEQRAGGNPSWNVGVDYSSLLAASADRDEVVALYQQAGLDLNADLAALANGARIKPDRAAASYLERYVSFNGQLTIPVLSMHTTGDGLVVPPNEGAYAGVVATAGKQDLLRQVFVHRAGHCAFSPAETITALQQLLRRLDTGRWDDAALKPDAMNASALAQGPSLNSFFGFD
ncbi:MAG TPA: prolyl oligopeptidase family serine peptidase, partial [Candidatus Dormibacteraeota bacterium]|nr:prolyl oligopeptidase family serine peptidase [Candidatus Dormibacteraeota bacterium]